MWCRFYQWQIERTIDDRYEQWTERLKRHLERCTSCKRFADHLAHIRHSLQAAPCRLQAEALRPLNARVMDTISKTAAQAPCAQRVQFDNPVHAKIFAGTLAAGLLAVIGVLVVKIDQRGPHIDSISPIHIDAGTLQTPLPVVASWPEKPMQNEVEQIGSDVERAVQFLLRSLPALEPAERDDVQKN